MNDFISKPIIKQGLDNLMLKWLNFEWQSIKKIKLTKYAYSMELIFYFKLTNFK